MTAGVEAVDLIAWAGALLLADSAWVTATPGGAHMGIAPQGTLAPVATLWVQSAPELLTFNGNRIWTDATLMVKHSGPQDQFAATRTAAARARALLHRASGASQGASIISCIITAQFPLPEPQLVNGVQWITYVQMYQVLVN